MSLAEGSAAEYKDREKCITLYLDPTIYSRHALLRASYWFTDRLYIRFLEPSDGRVAVQIELKHPEPTLENPRPLEIDELSREFLNSVLDFELRRQIESETSSIRQIILAKAFTESGLLEDGPPGKIADPVETRRSELVDIKLKHTVTLD